MTTYSPKPQSIVIDASDAADYLAKMNMNLSDLQTALEDGEMMAGNADDNHPVTAAGYYRWAETNASIRRSHSGSGQWYRKNPSGRPLVENKDADYSLTACGGDAATGTNAMSNVARKKGSATENAYRGQEHQQLTLFIELSESNGQKNNISDTDKPPTGGWLLLYYRDEEEMRAEVSLPVGFSGGFVSGWEVRVILPTINMKDRTKIPTDIGGGDVEFDIREA